MAAGREMQWGHTGTWIRQLAWLPQEEGLWKGGLLLIVGVGACLELYWQLACSLAWLPAGCTGMGPVPSGTSNSFAVTGNSSTGGDGGDIGSI